MQYLLLETLFGRVEFAAAFSFLSLANGVMVASIMFVIYPKQDWSQLWESWPVAGLVVSKVFPAADQTSAKPSGNYFVWFHYCVVLLW